MPSWPRPQSSSTARIMPVASCAARALVARKAPRRAAAGGMGAAPAAQPSHLRHCLEPGAVTAKQEPPHTRDSRFLWKPRPATGAPQQLWCATAQAPERRGWAGQTGRGRAPAPTSPVAVGHKHSHDGGSWLATLRPLGLGLAQTLALPTSLGVGRGPTRHQCGHRAWAQTWDTGHDPATSAGTHGRATGTRPGTGTWAHGMGPDTGQGSLWTRGGAVAHVAARTLPGPSAAP